MNGRMNIYLVTADVLDSGGVHLVQSVLGWPGRHLRKDKSSFQIPGFSDLSLADFYYQLVSHWSIVLSDQAAVYGAG